MKARHFLLVILAVAALVSCKEENPDVPGPGPESSGIKVTIPSTGPISLYDWVEDDEFRVNENYYSISKGAGTKVAEFDGQPAEDSYYMLAYPSDITGIERYRSYSFEGQYQKGNDSREHLIPTVLIEDATTWKDITLSKEWAESKGGTFHCNGTIAFTLNLPANLGNINELTVELLGPDDARIDLPANNAGTETTKSFSLKFTNTRISTEGVLKAYLSVPEKKVTASQLKITVYGEEVNYKISLSGAFEMGGGILETISISDPNAWSMSTAPKGDGTESSPYVLKTASDLEQMPDLMEEGKTVWFELGADIDMQEIEYWDPLNIVTPYNKAIHFDGKQHKISNFKCNSGVYPSFFGVLNGTVMNVTFDTAVITGSGKSGVIAGYLGTNIGDKTNPDYVSAELHVVTVENSVVTGDSYAGGFAGQIGAPGNFTHLTAKNVTVVSTGERVGGIFGQVGYTDPLINTTISDCTAENVSIEAVKNVGGMIGVSYNSSVSRCTASGHVTTSKAADKPDVSVGGLIGHVETGVVTECSASTRAELTITGMRSVGGLVGTFKAGTIEKCFATGEVSGLYRNVGGFVGLIQANSGDPKKSAVIRNCYATGNVSANSHTGGFFGLADNPSGGTGPITISNCYSSGNVSGEGFGIGGFLGYEGCPAFQADHCAAWGKTVTAGVTLVENWSSGAFSAITYPTCTLTDNYRNPAMVLTAWWVPDADYQHPNVSTTSPLIVKNKTTGALETSTSTDLSSKGNFPQYAYHGKVEAGKTLSELASTTLGWDSTVWDFSGELPVLK